MASNPAFDCFLCYVNADRAWAEWIAWQLEEAGYTAVLPDWDFAGGSFWLAMQQAVAGAGHTIAVFSPDFVASPFAEPEYVAPLVQSTLLPVRVRECELPHLVEHLAYIDLVGLDESAAKAALLDAMRRLPATPRPESPSPRPGQAKPLAEPGFPASWAAEGAWFPSPAGREVAGEAEARTRSLRVFLCHSSGDKPAVREIYHRLCGDGVRPWLDEEDLLPGRDWRREIPKAVRVADVVLVCLSSASVSRTGFVQREIQYALEAADEQPEGAIYLIPLRLEACDVPDRLQAWQWVDYFADRGYERLLQALSMRATEIGTTAPPLRRPPSTITS